LVVEAGSVVGAILAGHIDAPRFRRIDLSKKSVHSPDIPQRVVNNSVGIGVNFSIDKHTEM